MEDSESCLEWIFDEEGVKAERHKLET